MSLRVALCCLIPAVALAGCVQRPPAAPAVPPNPFGYLKPSAVCKPGPVAKTAAGLEVAMKVRSDDGYCGVDLHAPAGGAYTSFVLTALPAHGKSFIYNYNNHTAVTYTAATRLCRRRQLHRQPGSRGRPEARAAEGPRHGRRDRCHTPSTAAATTAARQAGTASPAAPPSVKDQVA